MLYQNVVRISVFFTR